MNLVEITSNLNTIFINPKKVVKVEVEEKKHRDDTFFRVSITLTDHEYAVTSFSTEEDVEAFLTKLG